SFITPTRTQVLLRVRTTSKKAKKERCTDTTVIAAVGRPTAAITGNASIGQNQGCKPNSKCAAKALSVIKTLNRCAASVALPCVEAVGGVEPLRPHPKGLPPRKSGNEGHVPLPCFM